jgi:hypothetical protein
MLRFFRTMRERTYVHRLCDHFSLLFVTVERYVWETSGYVLRRKTEKFACSLLHVSFLHGLNFELEGRGDMFLLNAIWFSTGHTSLYPKRELSYDRTQVINGSVSVGITVWVFCRKMVPQDYLLLLRLKTNSVHGVYVQWNRDFKLPLKDCTRVDQLRRLSLGNHIDANNQNFPLYFQRTHVVSWGTILQDGRSRVRFPMRSLDFSVDLNHPAALLA